MRWLAAGGIESRSRYDPGRPGDLQDQPASELKASRQHPSLRGGLGQPPEDQVSEVRCGPGGPIVQGPHRDVHDRPDAG